MDDMTVSVVGETVYIEDRGEVRTRAILSFEQLARLCMECREPGRAIARRLRRRDRKRLRPALGLD